MGKTSKLRKGLSEGVIASFYTLNGYFCRIWPVLSIDKVKFSFKKKGTDENFDVYVDTDPFDNLCDLILNRKFEIMLARDEGDFPGAWKYTTGTDGSSHVNIGSGSSSPIVIQGIDASHNAFVAVGGYEALVNMAKWWKRVSKSYYEELSKTFIAAMNKNAEYYSNYDYGEEDDESSETQVSSTKMSAAPAPTAPTDTFSLTPIGEFEKAYNYTDAKPSFTLKCKDKATNQEYEVVFLNGYLIKSVDMFNRLMDAITSGACNCFKIQAQPQVFNGKSQLRFVAFPS